MITFLLIAVIILTLAIIGIIIYLWWLPVKINKLIEENDKMNDVTLEELEELEEVDN